MRRTGLYARVVCVKNPNERGTNDSSLVIHKMGASFESGKREFSVETLGVYIYDIGCEKSQDMFRRTGLSLFLGKLPGIR